MMTLAQKGASLLFIAVGFVAVYGLSSFLERSRVTMPDGYEDEDLSFQGKHLKGFLLGAEGLLSDWYWMQSLQYLGGKLVKNQSQTVDINDLRPLNPRLLYPYLDNSTDLDPKFMAPYTFGATTLTAIDNAQAIALTEKGIANNPDRWQLYHLLGYIYWTQGDFAKAADAYDKGVRIDGSPSFMKIMAASLRTQGGSRDVARAMYRQMLEDNPDQQTRTNAEFRLMELDSLDQRDVLNTALSTYATRQGRCAESWADILPLLRGANLPPGVEIRLDPSDHVVDPTGKPYQIDRSACRTILSDDSTLPKD